MRKVRYFECKVDGHNKFWEISWETSSTKSLEFLWQTRWGSIGSSGTAKVLDKKLSYYDIEKLIRTKNKFDGTK